MSSSHGDSRDSPDFLSLDISFVASLQDSIKCLYSADEYMLSVNISESKCRNP